ncbi:TraB/GumN family protein [Clostridiaceae bacterium M8S5]|nr:TraB/GumN family protein [Clostridiaceae bacterium M8S5]
MRKNKKLLCLLLIAIIVINVFPCFAQETRVPQISNWAIETLNEAERLGIFSSEWYYDGFKSKISEERMQYIIDKTAKKLESLKLEENKEFNSTKKAGTSREALLINLFNSLAKYKLPEELNTSNGALSYMQERKIIKGTSKGLELDRSCTTQEAVVLATRFILDTYSSLDKGSKGLLWKVSNNDTTIYLLGSIHVGTYDMYPVNSRITEALNKSDALIVEANLTNTKAVVEAQKYSMYSDGTTLKDHVSKDTYEKCLKALKKANLPETMTQFKPWSIASTLTIVSSTKSKNQSDITTAASTGVDMYLLSKALINGKPILELEGLMAQVKLFDSLSDETKEKYLSVAVDEVLSDKKDGDSDEKDSAQSIKKLQELWIDGNTEEFTTFFKGMNDSTSSELDEFSKMLFGKRDKGMAEKIIKLLDSKESKTYMVVIGSGHLTLDNTVIANLTKEGYKVEVVK